MTRRSTPRGKKIGEETRAHARRLIAARTQYWAALLARAQLAAPIVTAVQDVVEVDRLEVAVELAARAWRSRRATDLRAYHQEAARLAARLASLDQSCIAANACKDTIGRWAAREAGSLRSGDRVVYRPWRASGSWQRYWNAVLESKRERERWRNQIVIANEGLAITFVARRAPWMLNRSSLTREDLQQHAREGLHRAADKYDPERFKFSTYAMWWIRHYVDRAHQRYARQIRAPISTQLMAYRVGQVLDLEPGLTPPQVAERLGPGPRLVRQVQDALDYMGCCEISIHQPAGHDHQGATVGDQLPDPQLGADEEMDRRRIETRLLQALEGLPAELRQVVAGRFGLEGEAQSAHQLGRRTRRTRHEVEALERRALDQLRAVMGNMDAPMVVC